MSLLFFEHVNLNVPKVARSGATRAFYFDVLGCALHPTPPSARVDWANNGLQQFHLVSVDTPAQHFTGTITTLLTPDGEPQFRDALKAAAESEDLKDTSFSATEVAPSSEPTEWGSITHEWRLTCPYGNAFRVIRTDRDSDAPCFLNLSPLATVGCRPFPGGDCLMRGTPELEIECPSGTSAAIARFFQVAFEAATTITSDTRATVHLGSHQHFHFVETTPEGPAYDGWHVAIYIDRFREIFERMKGLGVVWVNPRFSDHVETWSDAETASQFRIKDILELDDDGKVVTVDGSPRRLMEMEMEVRCLAHKDAPITVTTRSDGASDASAASGTGAGAGARSSSV